MKTYRLSPATRDFVVDEELSGGQFHDIVVREGEQLLAEPVLSPCISNAPER